MTTSHEFDVIIAGGGPAGTSAAIHLANGGIAVLLLEQKRFPRPKLCGEFISPECLNYFERLGVAAKMKAAAGSTLNQTVFYSSSGRSVKIPSEWFGNHRSAVGLSRAEMDNNLLSRAKECGVTVLEDSVVSRPLINDGAVCGVIVKRNKSDYLYHSRIVVDATGRARALARKIEKPHNTRFRRPPLVAFKAHFANTRGMPDACEIYFYRGGYGGLNAIEGGVSNLCFIVSSRDARRCESNPDLLVSRIVSQNARARETLEDARVVSPWLAVTLEGFGFQSLVPAMGLLTVGDAAAFIDPFTGSGMLMALQSGELVAVSIIKELGKDVQASFDKLANCYRSEYRRLFRSRLRVSGLLRRAAFVPGLTETAIMIASSDRLRQLLTRGTRNGSLPTKSLAPSKLSR
jgi:flavin-dependent dehydrogenase